MPGERYPGAEWVPWSYNPSNPSYYKGENVPAAVVLHTAQGWEHVIRTWAAQGYTLASWHFTVCRDGRVLQHIELEDGGYQAGIAHYRENGQPNPEPTWTGWRGWNVNVNKYTIGIEHEGMSGSPWTEAQTAASIALCRWLAETIGFAFDRDHFPSHSDIALIDRANDFNYPNLREPHYVAMFTPPLPGPPPSASQPAPTDLPINASSEQMRIIQEALYKEAALVPVRYTHADRDIPVEPAFDHGRGYIPAGALVVEYTVVIIVDPNEVRLT